MTQIHNLAIVWMVTVTGIGIAGRGPLAWLALGILLWCGIRLLSFLIQKRREDLDA